MNNKKIAVLYRTFCNWQLNYANFPERDSWLTVPTAISHQGPAISDRLMWQPERKWLLFIWQNNYPLVSFPLLVVRAYVRVCACLCVSVCVCLCLCVWGCLCGCACIRFNSSIQRFFTRGGSAKAITNGNAAFNPDDYSFHGDGDDPTKRLLPEGQ